MKRLATLVGSVAVFSASAAWASSYSDAVLSLTPDAYYQLNDTTGDGIDSAGTHPLAAAYVEGGITRGAPGPRASDGFAGMGDDNAAWDFPSNYPGGDSAGARTEDYIPVTGTGTRTVIAWFRLIQRPGREGDPLNEPESRQGPVGFLQYGRPVSGNVLDQEFRFGAIVETDTTGNRTGRDVFSLNLGARQVWGETTPIEQQQWYMAAVVFPDGLATAADIRMFINGTMQTLAGNTGEVPNTANNPVPVSFRIGRDYGGYGIGGKVDEVAVWHRALSDADILNLYNTALGAAAAPEWNVDADGNWTDPANWTGAVPNAPGAQAVFGSKITAAKTVTLDAAQTVGEIRFDNANRYTIAGTNVLTIDKAGGAAITVVNGSHTISAPIALATSAEVAVAQAADTLSLSGDMTAASADLTKTGPGTLELKHARANGLTISGGAVKVLAGAAANDPASASVIKSFSIDGGPVTPSAKLDLANNSMIIDYTGASPQSDVRQLLLAGAISGNGIVSSSGNANTTLGYGEASATGYANGSFAGQAVDGDAVLIKFTYGGDSNLDGKVDVGDLGNLASNWQQTSVWTGGDFNYDGTVNVGDLGILATNWQQGVTSPTLGPSFAEALAALGLPSAGVPEPATFGLIGLSACGLLRRRRWA